MKIVVLGANGQLGRALSKVIPEAIYLNHSELDLMATALVIRRKIMDMKPDILINAAGYTSVDKAEYEQAKAYQVNGTAVGFLASACQNLDTFFIHISTDYVFDVDVSGVHRVVEKPKPISVYGKSKHLGESYLRLRSNSLLIRTSWVFGDGNNFVKTIYGKAKEGKPLTVVADQIGRPTYSIDLAEAILQLIKQQMFLPQTVHIQNDGEVVSWADYAREVLLLKGLPEYVESVSTEEYRARFGQFMAVRPKSSIFDLNPLEKLGITMPNWRDSLKKYLTTLD